MTTHDSHIGSHCQHRLSDQVSTNTPDWLSVVGLWTGLWGSEPPPMCQVNGSLLVTPPSLRRVPASPVPHYPRYYEGATTSRSRKPAPLCFRLPAPHAPLPSCSQRRSRRGRDRIRAWALWSAGLPLSGHLHMGARGISQVPWRPILSLCPAPRPRPSRRALACSGRADTALGPPKPKASAGT